MSHATPPDQPTQPGYWQRWQQLDRNAWLYLCHAGLLTGTLAMAFVLFNLAVERLDVEPFVIFGVRVEFLGVLGSLSVLVAGLTGLPLLWLINRIGFWWALVANIVLQTGSMLIFALQPAPVQLMIAASLTGIGGVMFQVSSIPFLTRLSDDLTRDHLFSANFAVNIGIAGLGSAVSGYLAEGYARLLGVEAGDVLAYRAVFATAAVVLLLALVPLLLIDRRRARGAVRHLPDIPPPPQTPLLTPTEPAAVQPLSPTFWSRLVVRVPLVSRVPEPWHSALKHPWPVLRFMLAPLLISSGAALLIPYLNLFFSRRFDLPDSDIGLILAGLGLTAGAAALIGPVISVRIGKMRTIVVTQVLSLPFLMIMGFVPVLAIVVLAAMLRQGLFNMSSPLYDAYAMERTPEDLRPTVIAAINGAFAAAYLVMPLVSTRIQEDYGFAPLFVATGICYTLAICVNYLLFLRRPAAGRAQGAATLRGEGVGNPEG